MIDRIQEFVFEQKCIPWRIYELYYKARNLLFNINNRQYWDSIWKIEKEKPPLKRFLPALFNKISLFVPEKCFVVDVGCGIGILMKKLETERKCDVLGIDISPEAIKAVREKGMNGIVAKVPPIPLPERYCDVVIATELVEHVMRPLALLKEMVRILKHNGIIIVSTPQNALRPSVEREHLWTFTIENIILLFEKISNIVNINTFQVKENGQNFNRILVIGQKYESSCCNR